MTYPMPKIIAANQRLMDYYASQLWHNGYLPWRSYISGEDGPENMMMKQMHKDASLTFVAVGKIMRVAAREWKRPYIEMYYNFDTEVHHMTIWISKANYLTPVISPLVLTAKPWHTKDAVVTSASERYATKNVFTIYDHDFAMAYFEHLKQPDIRAAMKIPADVQPIPLW